MLIESVNNKALCVDGHDPARIHEARFALGVEELAQPGALRGLGALGILLLAGEVTQHRALGLRRGHAPRVGHAAPRVLLVPGAGPRPVVVGRGDKKESRASWAL